MVLLHKVTPPHFFPFLPPPANRPRFNPLLPFSLTATTGAVLVATCPAIPLAGLDVDPAGGWPDAPALSPPLPAPTAGSFSGTGGGDDASSARRSSRSVALAAEARPECRRARSCVARNFSKRSAQRTEVESSRDFSRFGRSEKVDVAGVVALSG